MQLGMLGLGTHGRQSRAPLDARRARVRRLDPQCGDRQGLAGEGAIGAADLDDFVARLTPPRVAWVMVPAAAAEAMIDELAKRMAAGRHVIDGGNTYYHDDIGRAEALAERASTTSTSGRAAGCSASSAGSA